MIKHILVWGVLLFYSVNAMAWGHIGHKASAKVAWAFLDSSTQAKLLEMLKGGDIADASVWPDVARGNAEWKYSIWYHFEKAPDNYTYLDNLKRLDPNLKKLGGLIEALYVAEDVMKNPLATDTDKAIALKFVIHCIGDIHQPFHTGRDNDMGGNKVPMKWLGADTNIHAVWDSQIIYLAHKEILNPQSLFTSGNNDSAQNYANYLLEKFKDYKPDASLFVKYDDWMHESMVSRNEAYDAKNLDEHSYTSKFVDTVDKRIFIAGLRIAIAIRRLVNNEASTQPLDTLRRAIVSIVGDFTKFVTFKPRPPQAAPPNNPPKPPTTPLPIDTTPPPPAPPLPAEPVPVEPAPPVAPPSPIN